MTAPPRPVPPHPAQVRPTRRPERARYDRATIDAILDEGLVAHVGFTVDGAPHVLPTLHARIDDTLYLHASTGGGLARAVRAQRPGPGGGPGRTPRTATTETTTEAGDEADDAGGSDLCVTVTLLDGLVFARSGFHHSMAYRSVVVRGRGRLVSAEAEKRRALDALLDHVARGRAADCRAPSGKELAATAVLAIPLDGAVAKVNESAATGRTVVGEEPEDLALPYWAGILPLRTVAGPPAPSADLGPVPTPPYLVDYRRGVDRHPAPDGFGAC